MDAIDSPSVRPVLIPLALVAAYLSFTQLPRLTNEPTQIGLLSGSVGLALLAAAAYLIFRQFESLFVFAYACFFRPLGKTNSHQDKLESFYSTQAGVYDSTRARLLQGRETMLKLAVGQLSLTHPEVLLKRYEEAPANATLRRSNLPLIWVDVGGGTGWNIETMAKYADISAFDHIYLVDLCPSLCDVARERFRRLGWKNITVLCDDATCFKLPNGEHLGKVTLVTFSYSLSMMPDFFSVVDKAQSMLSPEGVIAVSDFFASSKFPIKSHHLSYLRQSNWFNRWFWSLWFEADNVFLTPARREYLEHKFGTIKCFNGRNSLGLPFIRIPFYVWIGAERKNVIESKAFVRQDEDEAVGLEIESNGNNSEAEDAVSNKTSTKPDPNALIVRRAGSTWRIPYDTKYVPEFETYLYAFAWEDPRTDLEVMNINQDDVILCITSAGCNALEYATLAPRRIHTVDMNPCQNHLIELKLAAINSVSYDDFWKMFGEGRHERFSDLLDTYIAPHLDIHTYNYWRIHADLFEKTGLYYSGGSGIVLRLIDIIKRVFGIEKDVERMVSTTDLAEQKRIWETKVRPYFLSPTLINILDNPAFRWHGLGVPVNQVKMLLDEGTVYQYVFDTLDPTASHSLFRDDQYFYYVSLMGRYSKESCPTYLKREGFEAIRARGLNCVRTHTDSIINVLRDERLRAEDGMFTKLVVMDHLDWFEEKDAAAEIDAIHAATKPGATVYWRSSARHPWYNRLFSERGFEVKPIRIRVPNSGDVIDRVNMYASFYMATRL